MDRQPSLLGFATAIYGIGYLGLVTVVLQGRIADLVAVLALVVATVILIVMITGVLLMRSMRKMLEGE